jgi:hypothetical protein
VPRIGPLTQTPQLLVLVLHRRSRQCEPARRVCHQGRNWVSRSASVACCPGRLLIRSRSRSGPSRTRSTVIWCFGHQTPRQAGKGAVPTGMGLRACSLPGTPSFSYSSTSGPRPRIPRATARRGTCRRHPVGQRWVSRSSNKGTMIRQHSRGMPSVAPHTA